MKQNFEKIIRKLSPLTTVQPDGSVEATYGKKPIREKSNKPVRNNMKRYMNEQYLAGEGRFN